MKSSQQITPLKRSVRIPNQQASVRCTYFLFLNFRNIYRTKSKSRGRRPKPLKQNVKTKIYISYKKIQKRSKGYVRV